MPKTKVGSRRKILRKSLIVGFLKNVKKEKWH
jgi:hypothetical protein